MVAKELEMPALSEGEQYIEEYFIDENIEYKSQHKISLSGDPKTFRVIDFYLPRYDAYVEFFGMWNVSEEEKTRYREKKNLFFRNRMPLVVLYPENLGIIEHIFHYRLKQELRRCGRKKELMKYLAHDFHQQHGSILVVLALFTFLVITYFSFKQNFAEFLVTAWILSVVTLGGFYLYSLTKFLRDRSSKN